MDEDMEDVEKKRTHSRSRSKSVAKRVAQTPPSGSGLKNTGEHQSATLGRLGAKEIEQESAIWRRRPRYRHQNAKALVFGQKRERENRSSLIFWGPLTRIFFLLYDYI